MIDTFTSFAVETANGNRSSICQLSFVRVVKGVVMERFSALVQPPFNEYLEENIREHGILPSMTMSAPQFPMLWRQIQKHFIDQPIIAYCTELDIDALNQALEAYQITPPYFNFTCIYNYYNCTLDEACKNHGITFNEKNKLSEAEACAQLFLANQGLPIFDVERNRLQSTT